MWRQTNALNVYVLLWIYVYEWLEVFTTNVTDYPSHILIHFQWVFLEIYTLEITNANKNGSTK